jgi:hypothetical protein
MSVSLRSEKKSRSEYGKPDAVKVARLVWMRGKAQALPMHTFRQDRTDRPFDAVTTLAVASLPVLLEYTALFCGIYEEQILIVIAVSLFRKSRVHARASCYSDNNSSRSSGVLDSAFLCSTSSLASRRVSSYRSSRYWYR